MIHELIDQKKKGVKSNTTKTQKNFNHYSTKNFYDVNDISLERGDEEGKDVDASSNTFIPPWLKNSLGLSQRQNQSYTLPDQKPVKTISKTKESIQNDSDEFKPDSSTKINCNFDCFRNKTNEELRDCQDTDKNSIHFCDGDPSTVIWSNPCQPSEPTFVNEEVKTFIKRDFKVANGDTNNSTINERFKDEEKRKVKLRQRNRAKRRTVIEHSLDSTNRPDYDVLLENKAREILNEYAKKDVHSVSSDMKVLEAKLILLNAKCREADISKLSSQELRLLKEIKNQTGNDEEYEKLMNHIKETNLKEWLKTPRDCFKINEDDNKKEEMTSEKVPKFVYNPYNNGCKFLEEERKMSSDKQSFKSTDEESDIKRFSEFLSKSKNADEKRKCLEEVRNYFEKKRKARLSKRRCTDESKVKLENNTAEPKDEISKENSFTKDITTIFLAKDKKSKYLPYNEEIVEKAVNEALQKFMNLYQIQCSSAVMGSMKKNIVHAIQNGSLQNDSSKKNITKVNDSAENPPTKNEEKSFAEVNNQLNSNTETENDKARDCTSQSSPDEKEQPKAQQKTPVDDPNDQTQKCSIANNFSENENFRRLKKEFDNCLKSIYFHADGSGLKIQSLVLEKEDIKNSKGVRYVYNFSKKSLECVHLKNDQNKKCQNNETQTPLKTVASKRSIKCQTTVDEMVQEREIQTDGKTYSSSHAQTENDYISENNPKEFKDIDITPGLYRMVKSRDGSKFYLYPVKGEEPIVQNFSNTTDSSASKFTPCESLIDSTFISKSASHTKVNREPRILYRRRGRTWPMKKKKKVNVLRQQKKVTEKGNGSVDCLFFRQRNDSAAILNINRKEPKSMLLNSKIVAENEHNFGCYWFWNGKKIAPGCDLKTHVEDLVREKIKEISQSEKQVTITVGEGCQTKEDTNKTIMLRSKSSDKGLDMDIRNGKFRLRKSNATKIKSTPFIFDSQFDCTKCNCEGIEKKTKDSGMIKIIKQKSMRSVGIQSSNQTFLSLNISKTKSRSKTNDSSKISSVKQKKSSLFKSREEGKGVLTLKAVENLLETIKEVKKLQLQMEETDQETNVDSSLGVAESLSSLVVKNDLSDAIVREIKRKAKLEREREQEQEPEQEQEQEQEQEEQEREDEEEDVEEIDEEITTKSKVSTVLSTVNHESQTSESVKKESSMEKSNWEFPSFITQPHCELIESVLNSISMKQQESLWSGVRKLVKEKIGRDIDDEGAREVWIEIEQDLPGTEQLKHAVLAKGHYVRNEGDIQVEVDLTLDDLEKILRQRHKRMRRRHIWNSSKAKKLFSSSSGQSGLTKNDNRKYSGKFNKSSISRDFDKEKKSRSVRKK